MKIELNKIVGFSIIALGYALFFINFSSNVSIASMAILAMLLLWIIWHKSLNSFILNDLINLIFVIVQLTYYIYISILFVYGVEPIGTRNGTLIRFHTNQIAFAMKDFIFLVSLLPLVIINAKLKIPNKQFNFNLKPIISSKKPAKKKIKVSILLMMIIGKLYLNKMQFLENITSTNLVLLTM